MNFVKALQCSVLIVFILSFNSLQAQKSTQKQLEEKKAILENTRRYQDNWIKYSKRIDFKILKFLFFFCFVIVL